MKFKRAHIHRKLMLIGVRLASLVGLVGLGLMVVYGCFWLAYRGKIYPGVMIADYEVGRQRFEQALRAIDVLEQDYLANSTIEVSYEGTVSEASRSAVVTEWVGFDELEVRFDPVASMDKLAAFGRQGGVGQRLGEQMSGLQQNVAFAHEVKMNKETLEDVVAELAITIDRPGVVPEVLVDDEGKVVVNKGGDGVVVNQDALVEKIERAIENLESKVVVDTFSRQELEISDQEAQVLKTRAEQLLEKEVVVRVDELGDEVEWRLSGAELVGFLGIEGVAWKKVDDYLAGLAESINREPVNASFRFEDGRVHEFRPGAEGLELEEEVARNQLGSALKTLETSDKEVVVSLAVRVREPELETGDVNEMGIEELLGKGESTFKGSIAGRVHNVALTASKLDGVLVAPGEEFSFNSTIGEVNRANGYQAAYVIKDGRTTLGDGGGVCQDSTTLFRAVMDAGLPITSRRAHSYRVGYYEQNTEPGFDATVYAPTTDFKFVNDTENWILIQAVADTANYSLVIELYGTSDGRVASIENYQKWGAVPAPPPLYQDDPTLAPGQVRQVDWAASGLKVSFDYKVVRGGEVIFEKNFFSNYRPWQAVYLRGV